jgi:Protein of unknown function (DUF2778)
VPPSERPSSLSSQANSIQAIAFVLRIMTRSAAPYAGATPRIHRLFALSPLRAVWRALSLVIMMVAAVAGGAGIAMVLGGAPQAAALAQPENGLADTGSAGSDASGSADLLPFPLPPVGERGKGPRLRAPFPAQAAGEERRQVAAAPPLVFAAPASASDWFDLLDPKPIALAALPAGPLDTASLPNDVPSVPVNGQRNQAATALPRPPQVAAVPSSPATSSFHLKRFALQEGSDASMSVSAANSHTAIYDIRAHTVYLPDGEKLEAHSGLGRRLDDPRYIREKGRGPTPPNVYDLALRGDLFHGVRAIRLNPVDDGKMFGRDGILAHTYMLGPSGQSFGCVSFRDYPAFLKAYLRGEIHRLVVVPHLATKTSSNEPARAGAVGRYAFNTQ